MCLPVKFTDLYCRQTGVSPETSTGLLTVYESGDRFATFTTRNIKIFTVNSQPENVPAHPGDIPVLLKIGRYFIPRQQIRSAERFGKGSKLILLNGEELVVNINYDKLAELIK